MRSPFIVCRKGAITSTNVNEIAPFFYLLVVVINIVLILLSFNKFYLVFRFGDREVYKMLEAKRIMK